MQINIIDDDVLAPVYTCGKRGESIDVQVHGVTYSVWKLLDNFEKHTGKRPKIACKICHGEQDAFDKLLAAMVDMGHAAKESSTSLRLFAEAFNKAGKGNK